MLGLELGYFWQYNFLVKKTSNRIFLMIVALLLIVDFEKCRQNGCINAFCSETPSGLCFAGVLINFRSDKFQALDMSCSSKGHAEFFREFWHDL
jgi:hypothetical protein